MRTTLDIEDSVLLAVKELARRQGKTAGEVMSMLARQAMLQGTLMQKPLSAEEAAASYGFRPLPASTDTLITNTLVDNLRDDLGV